MSENKCSYRIAYEKQKKRAERAEAGIVKANSQAEEFERRYYLEKNALEAAQSTIAELRGALTEAIESIEDWSGYASPYFRDKYDVEGQIASLRSVLKEH